MKIKPLLKKGDKIGLITPSGFIDKKKLKKTIENVEKIGLKPFYFDSILHKHGYLAGTDEQRIDELHEMFKNKDVKAVLCVRGGYGVTRILDQINYDLIRNNPKPLIGYSDITALITAIYAKTGLPGFHGIVGGGDFTDFTVENFENIFFKTSENIKIKNYDGHIHERYVINNGSTKGILAGGNLSLIINTLRTPYELNWKNKIIFLEDVAENTYKIDRMLTQLISSGKFKNTKGIIFGIFEDCDNSNKENNTFSLKDVIIDRIKPLKIPSVYGFSFGHIKNQIILPTGVNAAFNTTDFSISIKRNKINGFFN